MDYVFETQKVKSRLSDKEYDFFVSDLNRLKGNIIKEIERNGDHEVQLEIGERETPTPETPNRFYSIFKTFIIKKIDDKTIEVS